MLMCIERPTEFSEGDVYIVECRYNEGEKEIRRTKGIKVKNTTHTVLRYMY